MKRRVVVTGLGLVTPVGNSVEATWEALLDGRSGADYIKKFDPERFACRFACEVKSFDPLNYVEKKEARKMGAFIHYAVAASQEAVSDSGLKITDEVAEQVGTYISSGIGDFWAIEREHEKLLKDGPSRVSPFLKSGLRWPLTMRVAKSLASYLHSKRWLALRTLISIDSRRPSGQIGSRSTTKN